jgi:hypothetical protein
VLVNGLQKNQSVTYMPSMARDREKSLEKVKQEIQAMNQSSDLSSTSGASSIKRTLTGVMGSKSNRPPLAQGSASLLPAYTDQDIKAAIDALHERWDAEILRMHRHLTRNYHIAHGLPWRDDETSENRSPRAAETLGEVLNSVKLDSTPTLEKELGLGWLDGKVDITPKKAPVSFSLPAE